MRIEVFRGGQIFKDGLAERIVEFDRLNMQPVFEKAGIDFPEEKRRLGLKCDPTFIIAFEGGQVAGYLEYLRSWRDPRYVYLGSLQIAERHRGSRLILELFDRFRTEFSGANEDFDGFETSVQKANTPAIRLYRKLGFRLEENPHNPASWRAVAGKNLLETSPVIPLINKLRRREKKQG